MKNKPINFHKVFKDSIDLYKRHFLILVILYAIYEFAYYISGEENLFQFQSLILSFMLYPLIDAAGTVYLDLHRAEQKVSFSKILHWIGRRLIPVVVINTLLIVFFILGLLLFIIPGILVAVTFGMAHYFVLLEDKKPLESFELSRALTKGNRTRILVIGIASLLPAIVVTILTGLTGWSYNLWMTGINIFIQPFFLVLYYALWRNLRTASSLR